MFKTARQIAMKLFGRASRSREEAEGKAEVTALVEATEPPEEIKDEQTEEDKAQEEEINRMLDEAMEKQKEEKEKREKELAAARMEYDGITDGQSELNFHLPLFFLLMVLTILSSPSVVTWAKNYQYSRTLAPDPMLIPATCVLAALGIIWQLNTPRNL